MGGEPLVEWKMVKNITAYAQSRGINNFNLCTNVILISNDKLHFFWKNNFNLMLSVDGISVAHNAERINHKGKGSFFAVDRAISKISANNDKIKFTIQMCLTPSNIQYLSESFKYLIEKGIANTKIYLIPIVDPIYAWEKDNFESFREEVKKISEIYKENNSSLTGCKLIFGKCCSPYGISELRKTNYLKKELCLCNNKYYGIDINGNIYYCFFSGFSKFKKLREDYKLGNIWSGIVNKEKLREFSGKGIKRYMSCLAWNYIKNKDVHKPVYVYKKMYNIWINSYEK
jgi:sulfatase maturation enzyme AslB (radical SAM superfamily)